MAYNVISCRKVSENNQILKINPDLRNHQKNNHTPLSGTSATVSYVDGRDGVVIKGKGRGRQKDRNTKRLKDKKTKRQKDRKTERQKDKNVKKSN